MQKKKLAVETGNEQLLTGLLSCCSSSSLASELLSLSSPFSDPRLRLVQQWEEWGNNDCSGEQQVGEFTHYDFDLMLEADLAGRERMLTLSFIFLESLKKIQLFFCTYMNVCL